MEEGGGELEVRGQTKDDIVVEISQEDKALVSSIKRTMEDISSQVFIFRVPEETRSKNDRSYSPVKVSIGPLHRGKEALKPMEVEKWKYLASLLNRKPNLEESLDDCVKALRESEHRVKNCYDKILGLSSDDFIQVMLVDSCFIIELLLKYSIKGLRRRNDVIFSTQGMLYNLRRDMILLENQIPLFVLQQMFHIVPIPAQCAMSFNELASRFFKNMIPGDLGYLKERFSQEGYHLLDLVRRCIIPTHPQVRPKDAASPKSLEPAKRLWQSGVWFKNGKTYNLLDVTFRHGVLRIPRVDIHECIEELFRNLIQLETHLADTQQTTSYAFLMKCLVHSEEDVKFLEEKGILSYDEGKEKVVAEMFQKLGEEVTAKDKYYIRLLEQVDEFRTKSFHAKWQKLKKSCCKKKTLCLCLW